MQTKLCSKCKEEKKLSEFRNNLKGKFNKKAYCISCDNNYQKELYIKYKELRIINSKQWNEKNPDKVKQYQKTWRDKNK